MIGVREPSWSGYFRCIAWYDDCASASVGCEVTDTRKRPSPAGACSAGSTWVGVVAAIRVRGSAEAAGGTEAWAESGDSDSGALPAAAGALRMAGGGGTCRVAAVGLVAGAGGGAAAGGTVVGTAEASA